jgi:cytochrome c oxidase assembly protein subunit 11
MARPNNMISARDIRPSCRAKPRAARVTVMVLGGIVVGMVGLAYASEPLYRLFCQTTGFGGTTQVADAKARPDVVDEVVTVRFDANVNAGLNWRFRPLQKEVRVRIGEQAIGYFEAVNQSNRPIVGQATFNVTPYRAATYFDKTECFCFSEQVLAPGESAKMPVSFFVDPKMLKDKYAKSVRTITLSYTFFAAKDQSAAKKKVAFRHDDVSKRTGANLPGRGVLRGLEKAIENPSIGSPDNG